jgi:translation initiation factor 3 subunit I
MKPIILQGHTRPIRDIKFNKDGDFLFTGSNDRNVTLWAAETGERIGNYYHSAAVNNMAITSDSKILITGDNTGGCYFWDVNTGKVLKKIEMDATFSIRSVDLSYGDQNIMFTYGGRTREAKSFIDIYKLSDILSATTTNNSVIKNVTPIKSLNSSVSKFNSCKWMNLNKQILCSREDGAIQLIDYESGMTIRENKIHSSTIMDIDISKREEIILTASKDGKACVIDPDTFEVIHSLYPKDPTRNVNTAKISPLFSLNDEGEEKYHAVLAGGQESRDVTTTHSKKGGFELLFYNVMYGEELGAIQGHFGPVNTMAFGPSGKIIASGAEDATIRVHKLEDDYFNLP